MKIRQNLTLLAILLFVNGTWGQNISLKGYQWVDDIYQNLGYAMLDKVEPLPPLTISKGESRMAYAIIQGIDSEVGIELKTLEILESFNERKEDAVAALLAHELIHIADHKDRSELFLSNPFPGSDEYNQRVHLEMEADHHGILLAHRAGYNVADFFPEILKKLYDAYEYADTLSGYPVLNHRRLSEEQLKSLQDKLNIFEAANYYSLLGLHESAVKLYQYINIDYPSPELYNNIGVNYILRVLPLIEPQAPNFVYPLQLEITSRLDFIKRSSGGEREISQKVSFLLARARKALREALRLDPKNTTAYINLACLDDIEGNYDAAKGNIKEALKYAKGHDLYRAYLMQGIVLAHTGEREPAMQAFELAHEGEDPLNREKADVNIGRMKNSEETIQKVSGTSHWMIEKIDGKTLKEISDPRNAENIFDISTQDPIINLGIQSFRNSRVFMLKKKIETKEFWYFLQITNSNYPYASAGGVKIGDKQSKVFSAYGGKPETIKYTTHGKALIYEEQGVVFLLNHEKRVVKWIVFSSN